MASLQTDAFLDLQIWSSPSHSKNNAAGNMKKVKLADGKMR
jgi:hypothetical protein